MTSAASFDKSVPIWDQSDRALDCIRVFSPRVAVPSPVSFFLGEEGTATRRQRYLPPLIALSEKMPFKPARMNKEAFS